MRQPAETPEGSEVPSLPRRRRAIRVLYRLLGLATALLICAAAFITWRIHSSNASEDRAVFAPQQPPYAGERILVFSPHCDDEALGVGGFINAAAKAGADVRIVMMTNGDGFEFAAAWQYKNLRVTPALLRSFAYARQKEAIRADGALGVPRSHITFLGFPDRGLAPLWTQYWSPDQPYYSNLTACSHNPYTDSPHPGQPYCGACALADVEEQIVRFKPDLILMPHPNDDHPDHWATNSFVTAAMADLNRKGEVSSSSTRYRVFVVHHGDWPVPQGYHPRVRLAPPFSLAHTDTRWATFPLTPSEENAKHTAIHEYRSQVALMGRFLDSFVRTTECFGSLKPAHLTLSPPGVLTSAQPAAGVRPPGGGSAGSAGQEVASATGGSIPDGVSPVLIEDCPVKDTLLRTVEPAGTICSIDAFQQGDRVCFRVHLCAKVSPRVAYRLEMHQIEPGGAINREWQATVRGRQVQLDIPGARAATNGKELDVWVPAADFRAAPDWFISADTRLPYMRIDRAGWRELLIYGVSPAA